MKGFFALIFLCLFCNCGYNKKNKDKHRYTVAICGKEVFVEVFTVYGNGAYGGDMVSEYLTDSTNFRKYIGTFDNGHEFYSYECKNDTIRVHKGEDGASMNKLLNTTSFVLSDLIKQKVFE